MPFVFDLMSQQSIILSVQFLIGKWLKATPNFSNNFIPFMTFIAAILGYSVLPATATAAGFLSPIAPGLGIIGMAFFQNLLVTGTHSTFKNTLLPSLKVGLSWLNSIVNKG